MMRLTIGLALLTLVGGCDEKRDAPATATAAVPVTGSGAVAAPSGAVAAPSGAAAAPSGAVAAPSGAAAAPSGAAAASAGAPKGSASKANKLAPPSTPPSGTMPHGSAEDGTLKYNPPAGQNPPPSGATAK